MGRHGQHSRSVKGCRVVGNSQGNDIRCKENIYIITQVVILVSLQEHTHYLHCEPPLSRIVLTRDLKDAYKSGRFRSSKVNRSGGSVVEFGEMKGAATLGGAADTEG